MSNLESLSFDQINKIYSKYFTLGYLGSSISDKMACIALVCSITNELKKKDKKVTCYDVLLKLENILASLKRCLFKGFRSHL